MGTASAYEDCDKLGSVSELEKRLVCLQKNNAELRLAVEGLKRDLEAMRPQLQGVVRAGDEIYFSRPPWGPPMQRVCLTHMQTQVSMHDCPTQPTRFKIEK